MQGKARQGRRLALAGAAVLVVALGVGVLAATRIAGMAVGTAQRLVDAPVRQGPFDGRVDLEPGTWIVYAACGEGQGCETGGLAPDALTITDPDGATLPVRRADSPTITRAGQEYRGEVGFPVDAHGSYRLALRSDAAFVLAPALESIVRPSLVWLGVGLGAALGFVVGIVLLVVGLVLLYRTRRAPPSRPVPPPP